MARYFIAGRVMVSTLLQMAGARKGVVWHPTPGKIGVLKERTKMNTRRKRLLVASLAGNSFTT